MDPQDFISLAIRLSNGPIEADLRSAVSRAYYGAFHVARQFLQDCGLRLLRKELDAAEVHRKVRYCLSAARNADATFAANRLKSLRERRNIADYDLHSTDFSRPAEIKLFVRAAIQIADALQRCRAEPTFAETRDEIRTYARDVLRLTVTDS
jgi:hypothetical protein